MDVRGASDISGFPSVVAGHDDEVYRRWVQHIGCGQAALSEMT
jgi:hypothetical protein